MYVCMYVCIHTVQIYLTFITFDVFTFAYNTGNSPKIVSRTVVSLKKFFLYTKRAKLSRSSALNNPPPYGHVTTT